MKGADVLLEEPDAKRDPRRVDLEHALDVARRAAEAAGRAALRHFRRGVRVERKADRSPVTVADREAEAAVLEVLRADFPDHDVLGEETGEHARGSEHRWIVDPIDGTRGFTRGGSFWGPLIALQREDEVLVGVLALPALGTNYSAARGLGCWRDGERLRVSDVIAWDEATLSLGELSKLLAPPYRDGVLELATTAASVRCYGDVAGVTMLLDGRAEAWIEAGVEVWDVAPARVLVEEAGGRFQDFAGGADVARGEAIATNGRVHEHVVAALRRA